MTINFEEFAKEGRAGKIWGAGISVEGIDRRKYQNHFFIAQKIPDRRPGQTGHVLGQMPKEVQEVFDFEHSSNFRKHKNI